MFQRLVPTNALAVTDCVYSCDVAFSTTFFAALGSVDSLYPKRSSSISSRLEGVLRHVGANPCCLLDRVGIDLLLFLVSQWWQSAWLDAVSWNLEVRRPDFFLDSCWQRCTEFLRKGQAEIPHSCLGSRLYVGCLSDLYVGDGLERPNLRPR